MFRLSVQRPNVASLGALPTGRWEMTPNSSNTVDNAAACREVDGSIFDDGRLCCNRIGTKDPYWLCRRVDNPVAPRTNTTDKTKKKDGTILGMNQSTAIAAGAGVLAAVGLAVFALKKG